MLGNDCSKIFLFFFELFINLLIMIVFNVNFLLDG